MTASPGSRTATAKAMKRRTGHAALVAAAAASLAAGMSPAADGGVGVDQVVFDSRNGVSAIEAPSVATAGTDPKVIVAYVAADGPAGSRQTIWGVNGCGLSWLGSGGETVSNHANDQDGVAAAYYAVSYKPLADCVVKARLGTGGYAASITVTVLSGAKPRVTFTKASGASGAPQAVAQAAPGSLVFGVGNDWDGAVSRTLLPGQSIVSESVNTDVGDTFWVQRFTNPALEPGAVVVGTTAPDDHQWNFVTATVHPA
ncbi:hypothetical protein [Nonomuraea dietziae]